MLKLNGRECSSLEYFRSHNVESNVYMRNQSPPVKLGALVQLFICALFETILFRLFFFVRS